MSKGNWISAISSPITLTIFLTLNLAVSSFLVSKIDDQEGYCITGRMQLNELSANARGNVDRLASMRNAAFIVEFSNVSTPRAIKLAAEISLDIHNLEKALARDERERKAAGSEMDRLCDDIGSSKRKATILNIFLTAALAVYGFWAGTRQGKSDHG